jgi:hypothetical protein
MMDETDAIIKQGRFSNDLRSLDALLGDVDGDKVVLEAEELLATPLRPVRGGGPRRAAS